jgi:hypothetical protein
LKGALNQCCVLACVLESILLVLVLKIVLQHIPPESGHRSVAGKKRVVALATRSKKQSRAEGDLQLPE